MEVVARVLLPVPRRGCDESHPPDRAGPALGVECRGQGLPTRLIRIHGVERPPRKGDAGVEGAAGHVRHQRDLPLREGAQRRLAQARTAPPRVGPQEEPVTRGARDVALALPARSALAPAPGPAQDGAARTSVAVVEFVTVDASAYPNADSVRTALGSSGHTPEGWLAADLAAVGRYAPIGEPQVAAALTARGLTPRDCSDLTCAVALGRALGADRVVTGRISRLSNLIWLLYGAMVDVATGRVRYRDEFEIKGDIVDLLPKATLAMARRLTSADSPSAASLTPPTPPAQAPQGERLTRDQVLAALAAATPQHPVDLTGKDLSGLDLAGVDFKRANLSRCRCVGTNFSKAQMFSVPLSCVVATHAA